MAAPAPRLIHGDCLATLKGMADNCLDSIVTDPPYGLSFMGKKWDYDVPGVEVWAECLRVLKPGGHLLAFAGTRTQHRMATGIEDAGFEIRDMIAWVYGSGFPKSFDVSKAIDRAAGAERENVLVPTKPGNTKNEFGVTYADKTHAGFTDISAPATPEAQQWQGWGTALKPSLEPITVARKPLIGTVAENVLQWGTGAINVEGCRVGSETVEAGRAGRCGCAGYSGGLKGQQTTGVSVGRWPANLIHDGSDEVVGLFPLSNGGAFPKKSNIPTGQHYEGGWGAVDNGARTEMGSGSAARFFYSAKASQEDRDAGLDGFEEKRGGCVEYDAKYRDGVGEGRMELRRNTHPTVKPTDLMRYLCRLVTPPGGVVLDPFMGSGSTGKAAVLEGFGFVGIEREADYVAIAQARIAHAQTLKTAGAQKLKPAPAHTYDLFAA